MGIFYIEGEYDAMIFVSPLLSDKILNQNFVSPPEVIAVDIFLDDSEFMCAYVDKEYFEEFGLDVTFKIIVGENKESKEYKFCIEMVPVPQKQFERYKKNTGLHIKMQD